MKAEDFINWGELSRHLSGSRYTIRKNKIPKIHLPVITEILNSVTSILNKLPDRANVRGQKLNNKELLSDALSKK